MNTYYKRSILFEKTSAILLLFVAAVLVGCVTGESFATAKKDKVVCLDNSDACKLLNRWLSQDKAAGNIGDWYDNRDGGHSRLRVKAYPQLSVVTYTEDEKAQKLHWGGQNRLLKQITVGNSSTSASVKSGGSNPRSNYYTRPKGLEFLYAQYRYSNLYVYPEHRDYDKGHNNRPGYGDLYPTNTPYLVISQGSSGSDQKLVRTFIKTLAAFHPDVKKKMHETGLLMPTLQMIFRTGNKNIRFKEEYLTGKAHPTVFKGGLVDPLKMVQKANRIRLDDIPPLVGLKVVEEDHAIRGMDYFEVEGSEKLADTPAVIARIFRGTVYAKRMVVSAEQSVDINKRPLTYHWVVLRGDADRISINTRKDGAVAELIIPYHERLPISKGATMESNRVDIGVFVHNGVWYSAPGFVTVFFLDNEARTYDADGRILDIYYAASETKIGYPTSDFKAFANKRYDIFDWNELFNTVLSKENGLPILLLREQFNTTEMKIIAAIAASFRPIHQKLVGLDGKLESLRLTRKESDLYARACKKKLDDAEAAYQMNPTLETKKSVDETNEAYDAAVKDIELIRENNKRIRKDKEDLQKILKDIFLSEKKGIQTNIKDLIEGALNRIKNNPHLYIDNKDAIHSLVNASSVQKKKSSTTAWKKYGSYGLQSIQQADASKSNGATAAEKNLIQRFNLFIMNQFLYPEFLNRQETVNFVDFRLTTPKAWRDVYHYDKAGNNLGWTRYDGNSISEYTPAGNLVVEKDMNGLVSKVQSVKYMIDKKRKMLKVVPVDSADTHSRVSKQAR